MYTTNTDSTVTVITLATRQITDIQVDPSTIVFHPDGSRAYLLNSNDGIVTVLDVSGVAAPVNIQVGNKPAGLAIDSLGNRVYVTNTDDDTVSVITTANNEVTRLVNVGDQPMGIAITPNDLRVYVTNFGSDTISIIDTSTFTVITVPVTHGPTDIEINPAGTKATITHVDDNTVTVLLLVGNEPPVVSQTVGTPDQNTGVVTGSVSATDADGDPLTYAVIADATNGHVEVDGAGVFTYTPTPAARHAAAVTPGADFDSFSVSVDDGHGAQISTTVTVEIGSQNGDVSLDPAVGAPSDGVVTGTFNATDPDGDALSYTVGTASQGTVVFNSAGTFVYTPTPAARTAAAATAGTDSDSFTVTVDDGHRSSITRTIDVEVAPTRVVGETSITSSSFGTQLVTPDGTRIIELTGNSSGNSQVTVIDTATGRPIAGPATITGGPSDIRLNASGTRAVVTTGGGSTNISVIDTATGLQVGNTVTLDGSSPYRPQFSADGTLAVVGSSSFGFSPTASVAVIDLATGAQVGNTVTVSGQLSADPQINAAGTRAAVTTNINGFPSVTTAVTVIDTTTGDQVGSAVTLAGNLIQPQFAFGSMGARFTSDGSRVVVATSEFASGAQTAHLAVIEAATGSQVGSTVTVNGNSQYALLFTADGTRTVLTTLDQSGFTQNTHVVVVDTTSGNQVGTTYTFRGNPVAAQLNGTRAFVTAFDFGAYINSVAVIDTVSGVGTTVALPGTQENVPPLQFTADGSRAIAVTQDSGGKHVTVLDTATANLIGSLTFTGSSFPTRFNPDFTRAAITTGDSANTTVTLVDTTTATIIGSPLIVTGQTRDVRFNDDGTLAAAITAGSADGAAAGFIDVITGTPLGTPVFLAGEPSLTFNADGTRAAFVTNDTATGNTRVAVINTATGAQLGNAIVLTGTPQGTKFGGDRLIVLAGQDTSTTQVTVLDADTGAQVGDTLPLGSYASADRVQFSSDGVYAVVSSFTFDSATSTYTTRVTLLNTDTGRQIGDTIVLAGVPPDSAHFAPGGDRAYLVTTDSSASPITIQFTAVRLDGTDVPTPVVAPVPIAVGTGPSAIVVTDTYAYVVNNVSGNVTVIDTSDNTVVGNPISIGSNSTRATASADRLYVTNANTGKISVIDTTTNTLVDTDPVAAGSNPISVGGAPVVPVVSPDGTRLYVTNLATHQLQVVDIDPGSPTAYTVVAQIPIDGPTGVGNELYFASSAVVFGPAGSNLLYIARIHFTDTADPQAVTDGDVVVVDTDPASPTYNTVIGTPIQLGQRPGAAAVSGTRLYVTTLDSADLQADPAQSPATITVIDVDPASPTYNTVVDLDTSTPAIDRIPAGMLPTNIVISRDGRLAYVVNPGQGVVSVIDLVANVKLAEFQYNGDPQRSNLGNDLVGLSPDGTKVYVTNYSANTVTAVTFV